MKLDTRRREAVALGALVFATVAPAAYVAQRLYERARGGAVDPSLILTSNHVDYLWRIAIASWFAGLCALYAGYLVLGGRLRDRWAAQLLPIATVIAALVALLSWRLP